jgi:transposase
MATPQKEPLRVVTPEELTALERLARSSSERVDRVRRATAVLAVVQGQGFAAAARQAGCASSTTVAKLVARFNRRGLAAVSIAAGRGRQPTYAPLARACIVATAQRPQIERRTARRPGR